MSEKQETIADIVAEMRSRFLKSPYYTIEARNIMHQYADRIEAAAKRDAAIHAMTCEANERLREHLEIAPENNKRTVGNAAAMREALEAFVEYSELVCRMGVFNRDRLVAITTKARDALSAPPKNCDRFNTELDAQIAFLNEKWLISVDRDSLLPRYDFNNWTDEMKRAYSAWLFATAEKGGKE